MPPDSGDDRHIAQVTRPFLGHEGGGEILEVGEGRYERAVGDHVIVARGCACGKCQYCLRG